MCVLCVCVCVCVYVRVCVCFTWCVPEEGGGEEEVAPAVGGDDQHGQEARCQLPNAPVTISQRKRIHAHVKHTQAHTCVSQTHTLNTHTRKHLKLFFTDVAASKGDSG